MNKAIFFIALLALTLATGDDQHKEGGWQNYDFDLNELQNGTSSFGNAYNKLVQTLLKRAIRIESITKVESQLVSGVNFKISFIYEENNNFKIGNAVIYVQEWTKTIKITSLDLTGQVIHY